jgi:hypothetical protein
MAKSVRTAILDLALNQIKNNSNRQVVCSAQPTTYAEAHDVQARRTSQWRPATTRSRTATRPAARHDGREERRLRSRPAARRRTSAQGDSVGTTSIS